MKLSKNFVKDYIDIDVDIKTLAEDMTRVGNEYDRAEKLINATKLIIGEVLECEDHPDSDHLHVCKVDVDEAEELKRLKYFLPHIVKASTVPVSVDTFRPTVADYALSMGASIINDESGCFKNEMADVVKKYGAGWIFMHTGGGDSRKIADYNNNVTGEVLSFFSNMKHQATACGINEDQLCYDCGIGFGKSREDDLTLLSECDKLSRYSPLLIGVSRKRIIGYITGIENPKERDYPSGVVAAIAVSDGAQIVRVHNVALTNEIISKGDI
mgnify:CR=1 FL=1